MRKYLLAVLCLAPCSSYAVLPYIFANQPAGNVPASYLDTDFSLVEGGIVQPTISTGSANSYSVAPAVAWVGGYSNYANQGLLVNFNVGNSGPSSINVSGLGAVNLVKNVAGIATILASGDINTNVPYLLINDGTQFWVQNVQGSTSTPGGATTNVQFNNGGSLAGSNGFTFISSTSAISVSRVVLTSGTVAGSNFVSDSLISAKVVFDGSVSPVTITRAYNVSSIVVQAQGVFAINGTFPPNPVISCQSNSSSTAQAVKTLGVPTTTSATIYTFNTTTGGGQVAGSSYITCIFN